MRQQTLGQYLRVRRKQQGVTLATLAHRAQVSVRAISYWENDEFAPRRHEVQAVLNALGVPAPEQADVLLRLMPLRGEDMVRRAAELQSMTQQMPLPGAGNLLAAMRMRKGWTTQQAARRLSISSTTLGRWENNRFSVPEATLPLIQSVYSASAAEMEALQHRLAPTGTEEEFSLEQCNGWLIAFSKQVYMSVPHDIDLTFLALQRRLWLMATENSEARLTLARAALEYGTWLASQNRGVEALPQAQRAFNLCMTDLSGSAIMASVLNLLSWCKAFRVETRPEQGERFLRSWLPYLQHSRDQIKILSDMGIYAAMAGQIDLAQRYLQDARKVYEQSGCANEEAFWYQQLTHARVLSYSGKPCEAYAALTKIIPSGAEARHDLPLVHILMFAEIMHAAGEQSLAETWLGTLYARMQTLDLPRFREQADELAQRL